MPSRIDDSMPRTQMDAVIHMGTSSLLKIMTKMQRKFDLSDGQVVAGVLSLTLNMSFKLAPRSLRGFVEEWLRAAYDVKHVTDQVLMQALVDEVDGDTSKGSQN